MNYPKSALENIADLPIFLPAIGEENSRAIELPRLPSDSVRTASERFNRSYRQSMKTRKAIAAYMNLHGEG